MADREESGKKSSTARVKTLVSIFGLICSILHFLCFMIGICSPHWLEHNKYQRRQFVRMGLFEVCFKQWSYFKDYLGKRYNGCWWIHGFEYRPVWSWLNPPWLLVVQVLMLCALILMFFLVAYVIIYFTRCGPQEKEIKNVKLACIFNFVCALLIGTSVTIFGIMADTDRQWLPHPDSNFLSWSFGIAVMAAFFGIFAGMCLLVEWLRLTQHKRNEERRNNMPLTSKPATRY